MSSTDEPGRLRRDDADQDEADQDEADRDVAFAADPVFEHGDWQADWQPDDLLTELAREVVPDDRWAAMLEGAFGLGIGAPGTEIDDLERYRRQDRSGAAPQARPKRRRRSGDGSWSGAGMGSGNDGGTGSDDECGQALHFELRMPAAAASGDRRLQGQRTNTEGDLLTDVRETSDGRLVVTISATAEVPTPRTGYLVTLRWETREHQPALVESSRVLATPLAPGADGRLTARYELGSVAHLDALSVHPAVWADPDDVDEEAVRTAFAVTAYGNALRAWRRYVEEAPARLAAVIRQLLPPGGADPA